jgi:hypothetical protein
VHGVEIGGGEVKRLGRWMRRGYLHDLQRNGPWIDIEARAGLGPALRVQKRLVEPLCGGEIADFEVHAEEVRNVSHTLPR